MDDWSEVRHWWTYHQVNVARIWLWFVGLSVLIAVGCVALELLFLLLFVVITVWALATIA